MSIFDIFDQINKNKAPKPTGPVEYIIVGLGNPGAQYENTRHNAGFMTVDTLAAKYKFDIKKLKFKSLTGDVVIAGNEALHIYEQQRRSCGGGDEFLQDTHRKCDSML